MTSIQLCNQETVEEFNSIFPILVKQVTESSGLGFADMPQTNQWVKRVILENVQGGKKLRGSITIAVYKMLVPEDNRNKQDMFKIKVLGWCMELIQSFALILDDIMDQSSTRRGKKCWYLEEDVGLSAINDGILLQQSAFVLLEHYFRKDGQDAVLMRMVHDATRRTSYGQHLDTQLSAQKSLDKFNMETYSAIVKYKTSFYTFYFPVVTGMVMAGFEDPKMHKEVEEVLLRIGHLFQVQDDYLDCFGDVAKTKKVGTDIRDFKCSWLLVKALELANESQRLILKENVGSCLEEEIKRVEDLYRELGIPEEFVEFEEREYEQISEMIENLSPKLPREIFQAVLDFIYRREG